MSIKRVAVILAPNEQVWHGSDLATVINDEDGSEELAQQQLMNNFAQTVIGPIFGKIDDTDAWNIWQVAQKNGFRIKVVNSLQEILAR